MSAPIIREQDKDSFLDHSLDWSGLGESIATSVWATDPELTLSNAAVNDAITTVWVQGGVANKWYLLTNTVTGSQTGRRDQRYIRLFIKDESAVVQDGSALFPNRLTAVDQLRRDGLMIAAQNHFAGVDLDNDLIWNKLRAAESEIAHTLRVPLTPTAFFPHTPTQVEIDALNGMPWAEDPAYDFDPEMFQGEQWGFIATRNKPIVSVQSLKFIYPAAGGNTTEFPTDWLRLDKKYGQVRIVPTAGSLAAFASVAMFQFSGQRLIPHMVHLTYVAGINAARDYPELVDAVKKLAVLKLIEDGFPGQSGSISADGLSQSISVDMDKYHESIDRILNGGKGNGGLMAAIHGIRMAVM